jgi:hypothetical protein
MKNTEVNRKKIVECNIIGGPAKSALIDALKYSKSKSVKLEVYFKTDNKNTPPSSPGCAYLPMSFKEFKIYGIRYEGNTADDLIVSGTCMTDVMLSYKEVIEKEYSFEAYYNAEFRAGQITFYE